jgi:predicted amino acid dehydrogenase
MTDNSKPAWAKALDIETQRILDTVKTEELTIKTEQDEYVNVTFTQYGQLVWDSPALHKIADDLRDLNWVAAREARAAYLKTPEGIAEQKREQEEQDARDKREAAYRKRFQWLHDKLVSKGCECNHEWCGDY